MNKLILKRLNITNFRGIAQRSFDFCDQSQSIIGANGTCKSTIADAWFWLVTGKNAQGQENFSVKPFDKDNHTTPMVECTVEAECMYGEQPLTLKRVLKETWSKKSGTTTPVMTGNETLYFVNNIPTKASEYPKKMNEILLPESQFRLLSSPLEFNRLNWKDRRELITRIVGEVTDQEVVGRKKKYAELFSVLAGKALSDYKVELAYQKKRLKEEIEKIPVRIDECNRSKPAPMDTSLIEIDINRLELLIKSCNDRIKDHSKISEQYFNEKTKRNQRIYDIKTLLSNMEQKEVDGIRTQYRQQAEMRRELEDGIKNMERSRKDLNVSITRCGEEIKRIDGELAAMRIEYKTKFDQQLIIDESQFLCPLSLKPCIEIDVQGKKAEMTQVFNKTKADKCQEINTKGQALKSQKQEKETELKDLQEQYALESEILEGKQKELSEMDPVPSDEEMKRQAKELVVQMEGYQALQKEQKDLEILNANPAGTFNSDAIETERNGHQAKLDALKKQLGNKELIEKADQRIAQLNNDLRDFSQQLADLEKREFTISEFESEKINLIEQKINQRFTTLKFKMFKKNITNDGVEDICDVLINGVPFSDANTASKINAGLEIINMLSDYYGVSTPVFLDNRESVTNIVPTQSQVINLIVNPEYKELTFLN